MDFQQLMKQASAIQSSTQRKHEQKKRQQEVMKEKDEDERKERVRKTSALLQDMKKTSEKKQLEYRGITNSHAAAVNTSSSSTASTSSHRKASFYVTTPSNGRPHPLATHSSKHSSSITSSVKKKTSESLKGKTTKLPTKSINTSSSMTKTKSVTTLTSKASSQPSESLNKPPTTQSSSSSAASSSSSTHSSSRGSKQPRPPVNFHDLMKLAEQKKSSTLEDGRSMSGEHRSSGGLVPGVKTGKKISTPSLSTGEMRRREGSPLGKQLLERGNSKLRGRDGRSVSEPCHSEGSLNRGLDSGQNQPQVQNKLKELAQSRVVGKPGSGTGSKTGNGNIRGGKAAGVGDRVPESALLMRERFRRELESSVNDGRVGSGAQTKTATKSSAKSNSFYGSSHAQLSQEGRPKFIGKRTMASSGGGGGLYQSSWACEMKEYVEQMGDEGYSDEEEEDDGLDDFVVDDEDGDDVSSAIREIFGYDKRRYRDEDDDDRMMESSFAQQQFEEMRSSRIGRQEDADDIRKEAERLAWKKRKRLGGQITPPTGTKQTKLSFK